MLSLNVGVVGSLVLPQLNVSGFIDFPWEVLPLGRSGSGMGWGELRGVGGGVGGITVTGI